MRLPTLVPGWGAESVLEFVFISIYCCWECGGGLCGGSEVLCSSFPFSAAWACLGWGRAVRVTADRDTSTCGEEGDPPLGQGVAPGPGLH